MRLIKTVRVESFRSIRNLNVDDIEGYVPIIGLNSSGKSNILRALNLFFNGLVDERHSNVDMSRDLSDYAPQGKKKLISVGVEFNLADGFKVRKQEDFLKEHGLKDQIAIQRTWTIDPQGQGIADSFSFGPSLDKLQNADPSQVPNLALFTRAVTFRYIPNHARPADLIQQYAQPLRSELVRRLQGTQAYKQDDVANLMLALSRTGEQMLSDVSKNVGSGIKSLSVNPALPTDFAELAFDVAIQSVSNGAGRSPEFEGSGAQSFILLHFLDLVDRVSRGRAFGWVQASIWAIEEPESFLHAGLRTRFAQDLFKYAQDPRRQVFLTTHQDEFVRVASQTWLASHPHTGTTVEKLTPRDALTRSTRLAITTYRHPLLEYSDFPMVIVEGAFDAIHLNAALKEGGIRPRWRLVAPDEIFGEGTAGDTLLQYLKYNKGALASRPNIAPVLVLRDWETKDLAQYQKVISPHEYSGAAITPVELVNPLLGESFRGIERYLDKDLIESTAQAHMLLEDKGKKPVLEIKKSELNSIKKKIADAVIESGSVGKHAVDLAKWVNEEVARLLSAVPVDEFLR
ncbi:ATP-dependent nuclease [Amycolatopsis alba]|uniref:AAA domain-containing protein n=1 Tax=Amycolatopsis alba DSM 44262 TaxID=1125972 RepID=A0A229R9K1_AMYAL|nr:AAA family ATPase [Amycolatopsis alba]OXM43340.1 hypothetical protein CFP75_38980 [Amycolatopsis alba DSM 44262]